MTFDKKTFAVIGGVRIEEKACVLIEAIRRPCCGSGYLFFSSCFGFGCF
nr:MAG TPA: hypothetical protein [Inoviridae sp.]